MWNDDSIKVELLDAHKSFVHMAIISSGRICLFKAVYASPKEHLRKRLWPVLESLQDGLPWVLMGDFNCVLRSDERSSSNGISECFANWVLHQGLIDLGFVGINSLGGMGEWWRTGGWHASTEPCVMLTGDAASQRPL